MATPVQVTFDCADPERMAQFAFLKFPDSPVDPLGGWVEISGNEARAPNIEVLNRSGRAVPGRSSDTSRQWAAGSCRTWAKRVAPPWSVRPKRR